MPVPFLIVCKPQRRKLGRETALDEEDMGIAYTKTMVVLNKCDVPEAKDRIELLHELCPLDFPEYVVSTVSKEGLTELSNEIYRGSRYDSGLQQDAEQKRA